MQNRTLCLVVTITVLVLVAGVTTIIVVTNQTRDDELIIRNIPEGLIFGAATASYQVEGAWNLDGKTGNIWDYFTHTYPEAIADRSNGDVAADSYHLYERDIEMARELGLDFYRLSIAWNRILPTGYPNEVNELGVNYYNKVIDGLLQYNIEPVITLYHWDLPQNLQTMGGWTNPHIIDWFGDYARVVFETFGDRVRYWITVNEPREICIFGYGEGHFAPGLNSTGISNYLCAKYLLMGHARAWHIYDDEFRAQQNGSIGITISAQWFEPESEIYNEVTEEFHQFDWGQYAHPIFSEEGNFPPIVIEKIASMSSDQGFPRSRLPVFTDEEAAYVRGTSDFYGLNHYTTNIVFSNATNQGTYPVPSYDGDIGHGKYQLDEWPQAASVWLRTYPLGFYKLLTKIREDYNNPSVFITENGFSTTGGLNDDDRIYYLRSYLGAVLDAIEDGSDIYAYTAWSLMDNFEWASGYTEKFGLYEVDFDSELKTRTPRKSAFVYKEILRSRVLNFGYEPDTTVMTIDPGH